MANADFQKVLTTEKLRVMFYLMQIFRTSSPEDSISSDPERTVWRRRWCGGSRVIQKLATRGRESEHQKIIVN